MPMRHQYTLSAFFADLDDELREVHVRNYGQQIAATYRRHFPPECP